MEVPQEAANLLNKINQQKAVLFVGNGASVDDFGSKTPVYLNSGTNIMVCLDGEEVPQGNSSAGIKDFIPYFPYQTARIGRFLW